MKTAQTSSTLGIVQSRSRIKLMTNANVKNFILYIFLYTIYTSKRFGLTQTVTR